MAVVIVVVVDFCCSKNSLYLKVMVEHKSILVRLGLNTVIPVASFF